MATSAIKRLATEQRTLFDEKNRVCDIYAVPRDDNIFEWHFTIRGPDVDGCPYQKGIYHGALLFTSSYPFEPPDILFYTPNGRFVLNSKICSTISSFHRETWKPAYGIPLILSSLRSFMAQEDEMGVGAIPKSSVAAEERERLAQVSWDFECRSCGCRVKDLWESEMKSYPVSGGASLPGVTAEAGTSSSSTGAPGSMVQVAASEEEEAGETAATGDGSPGPSLSTDVRAALAATTQEKEASAHSENETTSPVSAAPATPPTAEVPTTATAEDEAGEEATSPEEEPAEEAALIVEVAGASFQMSLNTLDRLLLKLLYLIAAIFLRRTAAAALMMGYEYLVLNE